MKNARILDPASELDINADILINKGRLEDFSNHFPDNLDADIIDAGGKWIFPGLIDMHVHLRVPGNEDAETINTGFMAAVAGGITTVAMMPNTEPPIDNLAVVRNLLSICEKSGLVNALVIPCVTKGRLGRELVDFEKFHEEEISVFSDDGSPVWNTSLLEKALKESEKLGIRIVEHPETMELSKNGVINEGPVSASLGVKGIPESAEFTDVERCISVLKKTGGFLHLTHLSSPRSVELCAEARNNGIEITCDTTPHHLVLNHSEVLAKGSLAKMNPPLRSEKSRAALVKAVSAGKTDAIASDHAPHTEKSKNCALSRAAFGITGLETILPLILEKMCSEGELSALEVLKLMTTGPADILGIPRPCLEKGRQADLILYDPLLEYTLSEVGSFSKSLNTPFLHRKLRGRVEAVWKGKLIYREGVFV